MLFALEIYCSHAILEDESKITSLHEDLTHDVLDATYLALGILEGGFATDEKKLIRWFNLLCPTGILKSQYTDSNQR